MSLPGTIARSYSMETPAFEDFYQEIVADHVRHPAYKKRPQSCLFHECGFNPLCGDKIELFAVADKNNFSFYFDGQGCSISQASCNMLCELAQKSTWAQLITHLENASQIYHGHQPSDDYLDTDLMALQGVAHFPVRIKCAALPWKTLELCLKKYFKQGIFSQPNEETKNSSQLKIISPL